MKKAIAMILSLAILFSLCACNNDGSQTPCSSNPSKATTNSIETSTDGTEKSTDGTEGTTATIQTFTTEPTEDEAIREIVLPDSTSKLGKDLDYKSSGTACYINVDGMSNKPKVESWGDAIVVDGVADYLDYLESLGFTVEIINTTTKEPYTGFYTYETNFKVSNAHISWTMYLFIQDEKYVEYQFDINLVPSVPTEAPTDSTADDTQGNTQSAMGNDTIENVDTNTDEGKNGNKEDHSSTESTSTISFQKLASQYAGKWYLDGYANVYLHIYKDNDGWLQIYTNNFFLPDIYYGREDGIVYPFLSGIADEEYCAGITIPPVYDWKQHTVQCRIVFDDGCIYAGSYKFVRTPGTIEQKFCLSHHMDVATCKIPSTCIYCGYTEGSPIECQYINGVCHFCGEKSSETQTIPPTTEPPTTEPSTTEPPVTEPPATEPPTTEPPTTEPPTTEPPATEPPTTEPASDVLIISDTKTINNQTIDTDVYITSTGVATFKNVTVNGNVYCYGKLTVSGGSANNLYAYYWDLGGITSSCDAWDGTHGLVKGTFRTCGSVIIKDNALDYAFSKWGKK